MPKIFFMKKSKLTRAFEKHDKLKRELTWRFVPLRKFQFKLNRLSSLREAKYSKTRNRSYLGKFEHDLFWSRGVENVSRNHNTNYFALVNNIIMRVKKERRKAVIIEFGPGEGKAIDELSRKHRDATFFGYANLADRAWIKHKRVRYIQDTVELFSKHFKPESADFIFSHFGLAHTEKRFDKNIQQILPCLRKGGILKTDVYIDSKSSFEESSRKKEPIIQIGGKEFKVENTPYFFQGNEANDYARVLTFKRIK